jgi:exodeoxyribonuclease V gamma subunit
LAGKNTDTYYPLINAVGLLPHGNLGRTFFEAARQEVQIFLDKFKQQVAGKKPQPLKLDGELQGYRITGEISLWGNNFFHYRCAPVKNKDRLRLWITHVCLNYFAQEQGVLPANITSTYLGEDKSFTLFPLADCQQQLLFLLDTYWQGLTRLLPFFPDTSFEFASQLYKKLGLKNTEPEQCPPGLYEETVEQVLNQALKTWQGNDYSLGELSTDPYYQLCFANTNPLTHEFVNLALGIYLPLLRQLDDQL